MNAIVALLDALLKKEFISQDIVDNMNSWSHSGFSAFIGEPIYPKDKERLLFAARYLKKCPLSNERIVINEASGDSIIEYHSYKNGTHSVRTFSPLDFLAEISMHIPKVWEQTSRFLGRYSSRTRAKFRELKQDSHTQDLHQFGINPDSLEVQHKPSASWARLMKKVFEIDPLRCRVCGGVIKIKAAITDTGEIDRIIKHLKLPPQHAPPKLRYQMPLAA